MKTAIIAVGLGFGDEGKGSAVDFLCRQLKADLVVRYSGGSQCGHNVQQPDGFRHTFSQFGAGTFAGVPTYLDRNVIIWPEAMAKEAKHLEDGGFPRWPFDLLTIHPKCLVSTHFHRELNRVKEKGRGGQRHGSCGHGVGETRNYWLQHGYDAVFAEDLKNLGVLHDKLELLKQRSLNEGATAEHLQHSIREQAETLWQIGCSLRLFEHPLDGDTVVFEGAQGVLLDEWYGFHPYTTWSSVTPRHALDLVRAAGADDVRVLGVVRGYMTRHGAGPFPTYSESLTKRLVDRGNPENQWQGALRCGGLDMVLLRYAAAVCDKLDGLVINHLDQADGLPIYDKYDALQHQFADPKPNFALSEYFAEALELVKPVSSRIVCSSVDDVKAALGELAPIAVEGFGPTCSDKTLAKGWR